MRDIINTPRNPVLHTEDEPTSRAADEGALAPHQPYASPLSVSAVSADSSLILLSTSCMALA
ncbi:MAG: hypothetical protein LBK01_07470, partial [Burkholderiaceae bacterium]|nr:hypothetical protein [Burkholderiaceae bacterium]